LPLSIKAALIVGNNGPKLKPGAPDAVKGGMYASMAAMTSLRLRERTWSGPLDAIMNSFPDRPVIDETGLEGTYDLRLVYTPQTPTNRINPLRRRQYFPPVEEQLGLKLEARRVMVDALIPDHIEKPPAN